MPQTSLRGSAHILRKVMGDQGLGSTAQVVYITANVLHIIDNDNNKNNDKDKDNDKDNNKDSLQIERLT